MSYIEKNPEFTKHYSTSSCAEKFKIDATA